MNVGCMITNGGPHPPEKWAGVTAKMIIDIAATAPEALFREATAFQNKVEQLLVGHHRLAQEHERNALAGEGNARLLADLDTSGHVPDALDDILAAARGTSFAGHFEKPQTQAYLERLLHEHMHHIMLIERSWYADAHPDHPAARLFKAVQTDGHAVLQRTDEELAPHGGFEAALQMVRVHVPGTPKTEA